MKRLLLCSASTALIGGEQREPFESLFAHLRSTEYYRHCGLLFDGKIVDLKRETLRDWAIGHAIIEDFSGQRRLEVTFRNEFQRAREDARALAIVPDLIAVLDYWPSLTSSTVVWPVQRR